MCTTEAVEPLEMQLPCKYMYFLNPRVNWELHKKMGECQKRKLPVLVPPFLYVDSSGNHKMCDFGGLKIMGD